MLKKNEILLKLYFLLCIKTILSNIKQKETHYVYAYMYVYNKYV